MTLQTKFVPNIMSSSGGTIFWSGKTVYDVIHHPVLYAQALTDVLQDIWVDASVLNGYTTTPRLGQTFPGAENRFGADGTLSHLQSPPMKADEYDQLIANPAAFIANVLLPRKVPELFGDRAAAKEALKAFAEEEFYNDIHRVILAGAFGSFMDPDNACRIGLLPEVLCGRIEAAGNIAGSGSKMLAMNRDQLALTGELLQKIEFWELASLPTFQRTFAVNMSFREE